MTASKPARLSVRYHSRRYRRERGLLYSGWIRVRRARLSDTKSIVEIQEVARLLSKGEKTRTRPRFPRRNIPPFSVFHHPVPSGSVMVSMVSWDRMLFGTSPAQLSVSDR